MAIKMRVIDWWQPDTEEKFNTNPFINLLRQKYEVIYSDTPDFVLCGPFGSAHLDYDCVKIYYTGENLRVDWNLYDYGMGFDYMDFGERYLRLPLFFLCDYDFAKRDLGERKRFCAYIVRHSGANAWGKEGGLRDRFFDKLSAYKRVDSGGGWRNNIGGAVKNKSEWLKDYKFNICFENSSSPGYLTEKLFDAYNAGCVPIYWGDTSINSSYGELNSSLGASFALGEKFGEQQTQKSSFIPKFFSKYKTSTAIRRICERSEATNTRICDLDSAIRAKNAESTPFCHSERSEESKNNPSLRANPQDLRGNPPIKKSVKSQTGGGFNKKQQEDSQNLAHESQNLDKIDMRIPRISPHLLEYKINPKAFINAHNFPNLDALVAEVKRIDNDEVAYNAMRNEPIFLDDFNPKAFYEKRVLEFFDNIFSQNPSEAFRRGEGLLLQSYRNGMRNARECAHLCKDAIRLAQGYDFIRKGIRVRNKLKFWRAFS